MRGRGSLPLAALVMAASACLPSQPSRSAWQDQATLSLEDVASEVATAQVVLREEQRGHLLGRAAQVMLVEAEEAAGQASDSFTTLQPPMSRQALQRELSSILAEGVDLVAEVRIAVTAGDKASYADLGRQLKETRSELTARIDELS